MLRILLDSGQMKNGVLFYDWKIPLHKLTKVTMIDFIVIPTG